MSDGSQANDLSKMTVVYQIPGMEAVTIRRDVAYQSTEAGTLTMDIYSPPSQAPGTRVPAVIIVAGYPDRGFEAFFGCKFKDMGSSVSWGKLMAASGMAAIAYTNRDPAADLDALLQFTKQNSASLGIDETRMGLWASSGNVPLALSALMSPRAELQCAVLCYGYTLDLDGGTGVAEAAKAFRFANPGAGRSVDDLPKDVPLFIARAGRDETPRLNEALDRFVAKALARNLPVTLANLPAAPHAFDLLQDNAETRNAVKKILAFLQGNLLQAEAGRL